MADVPGDMGLQMMLDGNAAAGLLQEVFGSEMTANPARCAHCGNISMVGAMLAFGQEVGTVLRCPHCEGVVMRIVKRPGDILLDMRGISYMKTGLPTGRRRLRRDPWGAP